MKLLPLFAIACLLYILAITAQLVLRCLSPGTKVNAKILWKYEELVDAESKWVCQLLLRYVVFEVGNTEKRFVIDEWDYNRMEVGDEGVLEYKRDEYVGFSHNTSPTHSAGS